MTTDQLWLYGDFGVWVGKMRTAGHIIIKETVFFNKYCGGILMPLFNICSGEVTECEERDGEWHVTKDFGQTQTRDTDVQGGHINLLAIRVPPKETVQKEKLHTEKDLTRSCHNLNMFGCKWRLDGYLSNSTIPNNCC